jgi:hypothetical protein
MSHLIELLENIKSDFCIVMIYLAEAHADDVWPLGFGINQPKTIEERWTNCNNVFKKVPELKTHLDAVFLDNMDNDFNFKSGAWPEKYFFADSNGNAIWKSKNDISA